RSQAALDRNACLYVGRGGIAENVQYRREYLIELPDCLQLQFFPVVAGCDFALVRPGVFLAGRDAVGMARGDDGARLLRINQVKSGDDSVQPGGKREDHLFVGTGERFSPPEKLGKIALVTIAHRADMSFVA